ncbi:MAG: hypothetical protein IJ394_01880 [Bacteroidales bacterium]|nr:hypothetical protein [Bacteroidales bacterium]
MNDVSNITKIKAVMKVFAAIAAVIAAAGCSTVEYTGSKDTPTETFVRYRLDWAGQTTVPSEMTIAMSRIINAVHFSCMMDSLGTMTSVLRDSTLVPCDTLTGLTMPNGEYYILAFNRHPDINMLSGYQAFISDKAASMRDMYISAMRYSDAEISGLLGERTDFNPTQGYIREVKPTWIDVRKANIHPDIDTVVTMTPVPLTQNIRFSIAVETEPGVEIEKVTAEISGVPETVQLMTGHISDTLTHRVPFSMEPSGTRGTAQTYEGSVCVLGLFPSMDATFSTGPGILQIAVKAKAAGHERTFRAGINLKQSITEAGTVTKVSETDRLYRIGVSEAVIDIDAKLRIEQNQIVLDGNGLGVEVWFEKGDLEFEI